MTIKRLCKICEKVEVLDENVVICKDCSRVCFNMEAWLNAPAWNRIEVLAAAALGNVTAHLSNSQEAATLAMSNFGIPLSGSMSAGFAVGFMKGHMIT